MLSRILAATLVVAGLAGPVLAGPLQFHTTTTRAPHHALIELQTPFFPGHPGFNAAVQERIDTLVSRFETNLADIRVHAGECRLDLTTTSTDVDSPWVSVLMEATADYGGAHPAHTMQTILYNTDDRRERQLSDLFQPHTTYLAALSNYCMDYLSARHVADASWIRRGAAPEPSNYGIFTIRQGRLHIHFAEYQVAPYALGEFDVPIPTEVTAPYLRANGPIHS